jgi:hypothetical protein
MMADTPVPQVLRAASPAAVLRLSVQVRAATPAPGSRTPPPAPPAHPPVGATST